MFWRGLVPLIVSLERASSFNGSGSVTVPTEIRQEFYFGQVICEHTGYKCIRLINVCVCVCEWCVVVH